VEVLLTEGHDVGHVDLVECRQHGVRVLSVLQTLSDALPHPVHLDPLLGTRTGDLFAVVLWRDFNSGRLDRLSVADGSDWN
ncbi:hypothetical protein NL311_28580, partial [Klebsiella pneumoniae]|nr:hypothetical protein [Klebsiella pneumoniae]